MLLKEAVSQTLKYSSYFGYPLDMSGLHRWLITSKLISKETLSKEINLKKLDRDEKIRRQRGINTKRKLDLLISKRNFLSIFPGISFIGVTGSTAAQNAKKGDDIDILVITNPSLLWIIRPFFLIYLSLFFKIRRHHTPHDNVPNYICPNLWLDLHHLQVPIVSQNLYTAHEVLQVIPIVNKNCTHEMFLQENIWSKKFLANAFYEISKKHPKSLTKKKFRLTPIFQPLNLIMFVSQYLFMRKNIKSEKVGLGYAYFHNRDYNSPITNHLKPKVSI